MNIIRDRGALFRETNEGLVENTYTLSISNKSQQAVQFSLSVAGSENFNWIGPQQVSLDGGETLNVPVSLALDPYATELRSLDIRFTVQQTDNPQVQLQQETTFFVGR